MADLTPKTIAELTETTSLADANLFPVSASSASKRISWENIKKYFVRRGKTANDVYISSGENQPITVWQTEDGTTLGLIVHRNYIGLYDGTNQTWIWRTPIFPSENAFAVWPVSMGGTGGTTADAARTTLGVDALISNTLVGTSYSDRPTAAAGIWNSMSDGTVKVGRVSVGGTNYLFEAMRNSTNYAVCTMTTYSGANIFRIVKTNGTVSSYTYTGTAS